MHTDDDSLWSKVKRKLQPARSSAVNEIANNAVTGALVGRTRGYNGEGNAAPRRRSSIDAGLARPNQLGESLSQLVQAADDAEGVPY